MMNLKEEITMGTVINKERQDYFVKLAPDFSVFDIAEKYVYDNNLSDGRFLDLFEYYKQPGTSFQSEFYRAIYLVYPSFSTIEDENNVLEFNDVNITVNGMTTDDYVVFPYRGTSQIVIVISDAPILLNFSSAPSLILGVAF
jgi:hypothetical protein